jgi:hypothetical protein
MNGKIEKKINLTNEQLKKIRIKIETKNKLEENNNCFIKW